MTGHRHGFGGFGARGPLGFLQGMGEAAGQRARRGDVRLGVLRLLSEQPMHGYQIIGELSARSGGAWKPSAGSVYPTLQMLADEGLVLAEEDSGKRVFRLTEAGQAAVEETAQQPAPWEAVGGSPSGTDGHDYRESAAKLARAVMQVGASGTPDQVKAGQDVLNDARKRLYAILAED
jgi:DNA-binding PadR family transcriptional regulator